MDEVAELKSQMRKEVIARRNAMDPEVRRKKSEKACRGVFGDFERMIDRDAIAVPLVALFSSFGSEVNLSALEKCLLQENCRICYPAMVKVEGTPRPEMMFFEVAVEQIASKTALFLVKPSRAFSLEEIRSQGGAPVRVEDIDFAVIPLVAFDDEGGRLGYGGGNYDEFLRKLRPGTPACGIAFGEQLVGHVPCEPHDVPLAAVRFA